MSMFCYQCEEASKNEGCTIKGICGKSDDVANLQDLLVYLMKGMSIVNQTAKTKGLGSSEIDKYVFEGLFLTITNVNFEPEVYVQKVKDGIALRDALAKKLAEQGVAIQSGFSAITWSGTQEDKYESMGAVVGVLQSKDADIRSLRELLIYGVKGMAAYAEHAYHLGKVEQAIFDYMQKALAAAADDAIGVDELIGLVMECGKFGVDVMALLDKANTDRYGHPEITSVKLGVSNRPGILISGHDLRDLEDLLEQTKDTGVDVYTHGEMLPAHYYPEFKKYSNFIGNYGNAWWQQNEEFETFNGPILFTTNCIVPPKRTSTYTGRVFTTGQAGYPDFKHIADRQGDGAKDFSEIIELAKTCKAPIEIESGEIVGGFAHNQVMQLADKVVDAVKSGAIKKFYVMAGCDGRHKQRSYYTEFAQKLGQDNVILTAGCAKFRYNKLPLGDIGGIPRVLDAGQCNDSYSLAVIALKLKEVFELEDINELPIAYNIAWYEQKAVLVLLALLFLGVKNIHLGPKLPAFLSPNVANVLIEKFGIAGIGEVESDLAMFDAQ